MTHLEATSLQSMCALNDINDGKRKKFRKDFSTFRVEHAELRQMGQLGIIGRYDSLLYSKNVQAFQALKNRSMI